MKFPTLLVMLLLIGCSSVAAETDNCSLESPCDASHYCTFTNCGESGETGRCEKKPEICTKIYQPVCGCDGKTYSNPCMAASKGIAVRAVGSCEKGSSGRTR